MRRLAAEPEVRAAQEPVLAQALVPAVQERAVQRVALARVRDRVEAPALVRATVVKADHKR